MLAKPLMLEIRTTNLVHLQGSLIIRPIDRNLPSTLTLPLLGGLHGQIPVQLDQAHVRPISCPEDPTVLGRPF